MINDYNKVTDSQTIKNDTPIVTENSDKPEKVSIFEALLDLVHILFCGLVDIFNFLINLWWVWIILGVVLYFIKNFKFIL